VSLSSVPVKEVIRIKKNKGNRDIQRINYITPRKLKFRHHTKKIILSKKNYNFARKPKEEKLLGLKVICLTYLPGDRENALIERILCRTYIRSQRMKE